MNTGSARCFRILSWSIGITLAAVGAGISFQVKAQSANPAAYAEIDRISVVGLEKRDFKAFLGIRYAQPPIGELRWQPPQPAATITRKADAFGPHCPQLASPFGTPSTSEDCLFLNVFTPLDAISRHPHYPVMVWIHGGALVQGESDDFDPVHFVKQGVIVVTINYRLGALGFLAHPSLDAEAHPGVNYGLLDQQAALKWVKDNIKGFGGDPRNVTIFGQSAGGQTVLSNLVSPGARGLFARAINQSGGYSLILPTLAQAETQGAAFAAKAGCPDQSAACLRQLPVEVVLANQSSTIDTTVADGKVIPLSIDVALKDGKFHRVPIMMGSNHDEARLFVAEKFDLAGNPLTPQGYAAFLKAQLPDIAGKVLEQYPASSFPSPMLALASFETDALFACNTARAGTLAAPFVHVFEYEFKDESAPELFAPPASFNYAAAHASELQFLFDGLGHQPVKPPLTPAEQELAQTMVRYWTNFAKTGNPNGDRAPEWKRIGDRGTAIQSLEPDGARPVFNFSGEHKCGFWDPIISVQAFPLE
jgi:para-nitrobenzyl esterase